MERVKEQGLEHLPGVFKFLSTASIDLINASLSQIRVLSEYLKNNMGEAGYKCIIKTITPFLTELVDYEDSDIRDIARGKLGDIAELMTDIDRSNHVLKVCLELVQEEQRDQNKVAGLKLLGQLSRLFPKEFVQGFVVTQLMALSHDPNDNVRVVTVEQIAKISKYIDQEVLLKKFVPEFKRLSSDNNWQVRLNFVEKVVTLASFVPVERRNQIFGEIFMNLLNDKTRWVKEAAFQHLGYFLALLDSKHKNDKLFEEYLKIPKSIAKVNKEPQNKICSAVAETLPKIIESYGESTWKSLSGLYKLLLKQDDEVRQILAKNIHLLTKSLKKTEHKNELLEIMKKDFLSPKSSEKLRQEALKNLANFLENLDSERREELADIYSQLQQGNRKWRIRQIIASQLRILSKLFSDDTIIKIIIPISFQLCKDEVAAVRETACHEISILLNNVKHNPLCKLLVVENIKSFASYNRFTLRQSFLNMCDGLMDDFDSFMENFFTLYSNLVTDPVVNVRISAAKVLLKQFDKGSVCSKDKRIINIFRQFQKDQNHDIVKIINKEHTIIEDTNSSNSSELNASHNHSVRSEEGKEEPTSTDNLLHSSEISEKQPPTAIEQNSEENKAPIEEPTLEATPPSQTETPEASPTGIAVSELKEQIIETVEIQPKSEEVTNDTPQPETKEETVVEDEVAPDYSNENDEETIESEPEKVPEVAVQQEPTEEKIEPKEE